MREGVGIRSLIFRHHSLQYVVARFNFDGVIARHKDAVVYRVERDDTQMVTKVGDPPIRDKIDVTYHIE